MSAAPRTNSKALQNLPCTSSKLDLFSLERKLLVNSTIHAATNVRCSSALKRIGTPNPSWIYTQRSGYTQMQGEVHLK